MKVENGEYVVANISDIKDTKGYLIGAFMEKAGYPKLQSNDLEVAILDLPTKDLSLPHYHEEMLEVTIVLAGKLKLIFDQQEHVEIGEGQFFVVKPGTVLQNPENDPGTRVLVIKTPSLPEDKHYVK